MAAGSSPPPLPTPSPAASSVSSASLGFSSCRILREPSACRGSTFQGRSLAGTPPWRPAPSTPSPSWPIPVRTRGLSPRPRTSSMPLLYSHWVGWPAAMGPSWCSATWAGRRRPGLGDDDMFASDSDDDEGKEGEDVSAWPGLQAQVLLGGEKIVQYQGRGHRALLQLQAIGLPGARHGVRDGKGPHIQGQELHQGQVDPGAQGRHALCDSGAQVLPRRRVPRGQPDRRV
mmetsp:Transcript_872/g.2703  ORF Transcript_872/g.2703 Transcript_872/m.2703 type:complete len:230 (+) Transcript_872:875-1564(+)